MEAPQKIDFDPVENWLRICEARLRAQLTKDGNPLGVDPTWRLKMAGPDSPPMTATEAEAGRERLLDAMAAEMAAMQSARTCGDISQLADGPCILTKGHEGWHADGIRSRWDDFRPLPAGTRRTP